MLVLMPKCPACVAGYIALATGVGISFAAATYLRTGLIVLCTAVLIFLTVRLLWRFVRRSSDLGSEI
jgi:membrane protein implicated in regulation of membrane protease activity